MMANFVLDLLFPPKCVLCGRLLQKQEHDFCLDCFYDLPECDTVRKVAYTDGCVAPLRYTGSVREAILRYKFSGHSYYAPAFGALIAKKVQPCQAELVTWVPVSRRRRFTRGYDQAQLLAKAAAARLGLPCVGTLRKRHTPKQSLAGDVSARRANIVGAFSVPHPARVAGKHVLLIDDICTTGATLTETVQTLKTAGAARISCAVLAITEE